MSSPSPTIGTVLGRYRIVERIDEGGMGVVFRAYDEKLRRDVALKILRSGMLADEAARERFHREALAVAQLNHRNVAMALDYGREQGLDFFVAEYVPGITLDKKLGAALPEKTVVELGMQLASGLEAAHQAKIIHRDLKPANLRVDLEGQLKILDFGLAQSVMEPTGKTVTALPSQHVQAFSGTMPYMAPEQVTSDAADARTDIWACGAVLYEMATGQRPFPHRSSTELMYAISHEPPVAPSKLNGKISAGLEAVILKALDKDPEQRYQTARELRVDLARIASGSVSAVAMAAAAKKRGAREPTRWVMVGAVVVALALLGWGVWSRRHPRPVTAARERIVAVLPFEAVGEDPGTAALGRGLTETVAAKLVQASDTDMLQVVSPRDLREHKIETAAEARREFGTDLVVEGTVERSGTMIRINCALVDSKTSRQLEARSFTIAATDSFGLQDQVVAEVFALLPTQARTAEARGPKPAHTKAAAYEAYVRGRGYLLDYEKPESIDSAVEEFKRAIRIDASYAPAHAGLGQAYWIGFKQLNKGKAWLADATQSCEKALALDSDLPDGHTCMGTLLLGTGQYEKAAEQFKRAIALGVDDEESVGGLAEAYSDLGDLTAAEATYKQAISMRPKYWGGYNLLGTFYSNHGRYAEAASEFEKVTELAPDNYRGYSNLSGSYLFLGKYPETIAAAKRSIELFPNGDALGNLGATYFWQRRFPEAVAVLREALKVNENDGLNWENLGDALYFAPGGREESVSAYRKAITLYRASLEVNPKDTGALAGIAQCSAMLGDRAEAEARMKQVLELSPDDPQVLFEAALAYNHEGDSEQALSFLEKAAAAKWPRTIIRDSPEFDGLKGDSRFQAIVSGS